MENQDKSNPETVSHIDQNIENILAIYKREEQKLSRPHKILEYFVSFFGRPYFLGAILLFVSVWILTNAIAHKVGWREFDPAPYPGLQGILTFCALLVTTVVLIKQNRLAKFEEQREHLELQVNLITEHKTAKLIKLIEELRRDLPMVKDRHDPEADAFQLPTHPDEVLDALHQHTGFGEEV